MKLRFWLLLLPLVLMLSACGHDDDAATEKEKDTDKVANQEIKKEDERLPICPQVAIVRELEEIKDYGRDTPDDAHLVAKARMQNVDGTCEYHDDDDNPGLQGINVLFDLNMVAMRGPKLGGLHTTQPYFIAVVDPSGVVLNKNSMTAEFGFSSNGDPAMHAESLHVFIPMAKKDWATGPNYQVLLGWQLTPEQAHAQLGTDTTQPDAAGSSGAQPAAPGASIMVSSPDNKLPDSMPFEVKKPDPAAKP